MHFLFDSAGLPVVVHMGSAGLAVASSGLSWVLLAQSTDINRRATGCPTTWFCPGEVMSVPSSPPVPLGGHIKAEGLGRWLKVRVMMARVMRDWGG